MPRLRISVATVFILLIAALWLVARHDARAFPDINIARAFTAFILLFAPLWFFGFGAAELLKRLPRWTKILCPSALAIPYFVLLLGTPNFHWRGAAIVIAFPVLLAAFLELPNLPQRMTLRDAMALAIVAAAYFLHWLGASWGSPALTLFPKLFLADIVLHCFLVIRRLEGAGYSLLPTVSSVRIGLREWLLYVPIALILGELSGFIHFHAAMPSFTAAMSAILFTALLIVLPEEMFFRTIIQNLLETRIGKNAALVFAALLFGLSHFNHGAIFNYRYVLLATIAGIFYGRAWRAQRQILAAVMTHTMVDVVWALWFR